jgi:Protein of unknown function (DUF5672)
LHSRIVKDEPTGRPPELTSVTLVTVTSVALAATIKALRSSMERAHFADVLLLSDRPPPASETGINWRQIEPIRSRADYSRFMLRDLARHIATTHALCVQWDGYILDGRAWDPVFLDFDYIGAPWPQFSDGFNVGNGGFSLRSRRLLEACAALQFDGEVAEDVLICRLHRRQLEEQGLRFAPEAIARKFSFERNARTGREFGFHGSFNLVKLVPPEAALQLFRTLEPHVLARSERHELFRWALARGRLKLALSILDRLV